MGHIGRLPLKTALIITAWVFFLGGSSISFSEQPEGPFIETWVGSPDLPDEFAYTMLLVMVAGDGADPQSVSRKLARIFSADLDTPQDIAKVESLRVWLLSSKEAIDREMAENEVELLCTGDWEAMKADDIIEGMAALESYRSELVLDHYEATLEHLSLPDQTALIDYLESRKPKISSTRYDTAWWHGSKPESQLRFEHGHWCKGAFEQLASG